MCVCQCDHQPLGLDNIPAGLAQISFPPLARADKNQGRQEREVISHDNYPSLDQPTPFSLCSARPVKISYLEN